VNIQENVALAPWTTLQVGGAARYFAEARREDEVREAVDWARTRNLPLFVLGGGSNIVVADSGWPGLVLRIAIGGLTSEGAGNGVLFAVGAGFDWDEFVAHAVVQNCAGVECLSGIPGNVGGTPVQNVGAYGQEVADTIESVRALDMKEDRIVVLPRPACGFSYRSSIFNRAERGRYVILRVNFRLQRGGGPNLGYADLKEHFAQTRTAPTLASVRQAVLDIRCRKGMLILPGDADCRSAGSFFRNPVLSDEQFQELDAHARARGLGVPSYPALEARRKVPAAWLVEHSGFAKGFRLGSAGISSKHALAIINTGGAQASEIIRLKDAIQQGVRSTWGILLEPEPEFVGF